jgi:hypothetical protein
MSPVTSGTFSVIAISIKGVSPRSGISCTTTIDLKICLLNAKGRIPEIVRNTKYSKISTFIFYLVVNRIVDP